MRLIEKYWGYIMDEVGVTTAEAIAFDIVTDLSGRKGLGNEWDEIDEDIQDEILKKWVNIVESKTTATYDPTTNTTNNE